MYKDLTNIILSKSEREILEYLRQCGYNYIFKHRLIDVWASKEKPIRDSFNFRWLVLNTECCKVLHNPNIFKFIKEDSTEAIFIDILLNNNNNNNNNNN